LKLNQYLPNKLKIFFRRVKFYIFGEKFYKKFKYDWYEYPSRFEIINKIIKLKNYKSYLEIGCQADINFSNINILDRTGVDPYDGGTHRMTSDKFFSINKKKFDIIFIDGLHEFEQVLRDIYNSINFLKKGGVILLHDCLPSKIWHQTIPQTHSSWNGDVWKALVTCRTLENLDAYTCVANHGIGVIINRKNLNILNLEKKKIHSLAFKDYYQNHKKFMNLISVDELMKLIIDDK